MKLTRSLKNNEGLIKNSELGIRNAELFFRQAIPHSELIKQSPIDAKEDLAVAHRIMGCDERVVVAGEEEHVAVLHKNVGLFDINGKCQVDERIITNQDIILQVKGPQRGHIGVSIILGEIIHSEAGLQGCSFLEDGL